MTLKSYEIITHSILEIAAHVKVSHLRRTCGIFGLIDALYKQAKEKIQKRQDFETQIHHIEHLLQNRHRIQVAILSNDMNETFDALMTKARTIREHIPESIKLTEDEQRLSVFLTENQTKDQAFEDALLEFEQSFNLFAFKVALQKLSELKSLNHK